MDRRWKIYSKAKVSFREFRGSWIELLNV